MSWSLVSLGSLCHKITDGSHNPPKGISNSEYLMLSSKNVFHNEINFKNPRYLTREDFKKENKRTDVCENDVLLTIVGTIGRVAVISRNNSKFTLQRSVAVLKPKLELITSRFLMYTLRNLTSFLERSARGVAQKGIYLKQIRELKIPLPPLAEQQKIAAILDAADQLRQKDQQLIDHYTTLSQSLFLEMFGDPVINPMGYKLISLGSLCEFENGDRSSNYPSKSEVLNNGKLFLSSGDIGEGNFEVQSSNFISQAKFDSLRRGKCKRGDVLMTLRGNGLGRTCVFECEYDEGFINAQMVILRPDKTKCTSRFLVSQLNNKRVFTELLRCSSGSAQPQFSAGNVKRFKTLVPPIDMQNQFAQHIEKIEQQKQYAQASLEKSETLFNSLLQRAFKGELTPTQP